MRLALYGKLPAKRDFVAVATKRELLAVWEPWLQGSLSASRVTLGGGWQQAFLHAPIWRFWLGQDVVGTPTLGAFMPSVDGVGRYFPLAVFAQAEPGDALPPPELEPNEGWFAAAEDLLLSALGDGVDLDTVAGALGRLPAAHGDAAATREAAGPLTQARDGTLVVDLEPGAEGTGLAAALARLRVVDQARAYGAMTMWWTIGGEGFAPKLVVARRMPDPYLFAGMLTGRFDDISA